MNKATLKVPGSDDIGPSFYDKLSDQMAIDYGRAFAQCLTLRVGPVIVGLSDGTKMYLRHDSYTDTMTIGPS